MHRQSLYLGLDPGDMPCVHYPVIRIVPRPHDDPEIKAAFCELPLCTHVIFTSKQTIYYSPFSWKLLREKKVIAIGSQTARELEKNGLTPILAKYATQEGIIELLKEMNVPKNAYFFYPRSSLARRELAHFLQEKWKVRVLDLYDTQFQKLEPVPNLDQFDRIIFTSPSTVHGFLRIFGKLPKDKELVAIGPVTELEIKKMTIAREDQKPLELFVNSEESHGQKEIEQVMGEMDRVKADRNYTKIKVEFKNKLKLK